MKKLLYLMKYHGKVYPCDELTSNQVTSVISLRRQVIGTLDRHNRTSYNCKMQVFGPLCFVEFMGPIYANEYCRKKH